MESKYDELLARDVASVKHRFAAFTPQLKTDLWLLQLERYLADHSELTAGQRAVIFQAVGLLYSGIMDVSPSDAQWDSRVNQPLLRLDADGKAAFDPVTYKFVFQRLGALQLAPSMNTKFHAISTEFECECSTDSDWCCIWPTCPEVCRRVFRCVFTPDGCGTFWEKPCNGACE